MPILSTVLTLWMSCCKRVLPRTVRSCSTEAWPMQIRFGSIDIVNVLLQGGPASPKPGLPSNPAIDVPELKSMDSRRSVKLRELLRECAAVKFDLQKGPLFRINLFKVQPLLKLAA